MTPNVHQIGSDDVALMDGLLDLFGEEFDEPETYGANRPSAEYLRRLLSSDTFIALVAVERGEVVGGLAAYELRKFEQERSEIYVYDLAVRQTHRRRGIATSLLRGVCGIGRDRGAHVVFVQADYGDEPAIALYAGLGEREEVLHFDIAVGPSDRSA